MSEQTPLQTEQAHTQHQSPSNCCQGQGHLSHTGAAWGGAAPLSLHWNFCSGDDGDKLARLNSEVAVEEAEALGGSIGPLRARLAGLDVGGVQVPGALRAAGAVPRGDVCVGGRFEPVGDGAVDGQQPQGAPRQAGRVPVGARGLAEGSGGRGPEFSGDEARLRESKACYG